MSSRPPRRRPAHPPPVLLSTRRHQANGSIRRTMQGADQGETGDDVNDQRRPGHHASDSVDRTASQYARSIDLMLRSIASSAEETDASLATHSLDYNNYRPPSSMHTYDTALESTLGPVPITLHKGLAKKASTLRTASSVDAFFWSCDTSAVERRPVSSMSTGSAFSTRQYDAVPVSPTATMTTRRSLRSIRSSMGAMNAKAFAAHAAGMLQNASRKASVDLSRSASRTTSLSSPMSSDEQLMESRLDFVANMPQDWTPRTSLVCQQRPRSGTYTFDPTEQADGHESQANKWRRRSSTLGPLLSTTRKSSLRIRAGEDQRELSDAGWLSSPATMIRALESSLSFVTSTNVRDSCLPAERVSTTQRPSTDSCQPRVVTSCRSPLLLAHLGDLRQDDASLGVLSKAKAQTPSNARFSASKATRMFPPSSYSPTKSAAPLRKFSSLNDLRTALFSSKRSRAKAGGEQTSFDRAVGSPSTPSAVKKRVKSASFRNDTTGLGVDMADFDWEKSHDWEAPAGKVKSEEPSYPTINTTVTPHAHLPPLLSPPSTSSRVGSSSSWKCPDLVSIDSAMLAVFPKPPGSRRDSLQSFETQPYRTGRSVEWSQADDAAQMKNLPALPPPGAYGRQRLPIARSQDLSSRFSNITNTDDSALYHARSRSSGSAAGFPSPPSSNHLRRKTSNVALARLAASSDAPSSARPSSPPTPSFDGSHKAPVQIVKGGRTQFESHRPSLSPIEGNVDFNSSRFSLGSEESRFRSSIRRAKSFRTGLAFISKVLGSPSSSTDDIDDESRRAGTPRPWRLGEHYNGKRSYAAETIRERDEKPFAFCPTPAPGAPDRGGALQGTLRSVLSKRSLRSPGLGARFNL